MSVRFIAGRAGSGKTAHCLAAAAAELRASALDGPRLLLLVPEQAALQAERALLRHGPFRTLGRCDVLGFRRLTRRILKDAPGPQPAVLSPQGRQMVLRRLILGCRPRLRALSGVADRPGLIAGIAASISELIQFAVPPDRVRQAAGIADADASAAAMLGDLADLYQAYSEFLAQGAVDPDGLMDLAAARLHECDWLRGARIWLDGFAGLTTQQSRLLTALARSAEQVEIALLIDPDADCVAGRGPGGDPMSLFARTEATWNDLSNTLTAAGVVIDLPLRIAPPSMPRFGNAPGLARIEAGLFHSQIEEDEPEPVEFDPMRSDWTVRLIQAPDARREVDAVAREIHRLTVECDQPLRYRDVAVVCRDLEPYHDLLSAALTAHRIPFFIDRRRPTTHHPLVEWLRCALQLHQGPRFAQAMRGLIKTGLTTLTERETELLENYLLAHGLRTPAAWEQPEWTARKDVPGEDARKSDICAARDRLRAALGEWWPGPSFAPRRAAADWASGLARLADRMGVAAMLSEWAQAARQRGGLDEAQEHEQVWNDAVALIDELADVLSDELLNAAACAEVLDAGLAGFTLGLVPPTLDQVLVGSIDRSRHPDVRAVFLLGLADGMFPARPGVDPILGERERRGLQTVGAPIGPPPESRLLDERLLMYVAVTRPSERLWISFPAADGQGRALSPSPFVAQVRAAAGGPPIEQIGDVAPADGAVTAATPEDYAAALVERFAAAAVTDADAVLPSRVLAEYEAARTHPRLNPAMRRAFAALRPPRSARLGADDVALLWPSQAASPLYTSVSRLESLARCPFQHFARHALELAPRAVHELGALDLGKLWHRMLEQFVNDLIEGGQTLRELTTAQILERIEHMQRNVLPDFARSLALEATETAVLERRTAQGVSPPLLAQHAWSTDAAPRQTEIGFGGDQAAWPAWTLHTPRGRVVELHGKIDRVDLAPAGDGALGLVFDYKRSRRARLLLDELFHGLALQLAAYLLVLREHGHRLGRGPVAPAGAFFLPLLAGFRSVAHPSDADEEGFDPFRDFQPRGVVDFDGALHVDRDLRGGRKSRTIALEVRQDGDIAHFDRSDGLRPEQFDLLLRHVRFRIGELADRWLDGDVEVRPTYHRRALPCSRCAYQSVCRFELGAGRLRKLDTLSRTQVCEQLPESAP